MTRQVQLERARLAAVEHGHLRALFRPIESAGSVCYLDEPHIVAFECGADIDAQMLRVNAALGADGWPAVEEAELAPVRALAATTWTAEVLAAWAAVKAAREGSHAPRPNPQRDRERELARLSKAIERGDTPLALAQIHTLLKGD